MTKVLKREKRGKFVPVRLKEEKGLCKEGGRDRRAVTAQGRAGIASSQKNLGERHQVASLAEPWEQPDPAHTLVSDS